MRYHLFLNSIRKMDKTTKVFSYRMLCPNRSGNHCSYWIEKLQKPCIDHMSSTGWEEVIQTAMVKTYEDKKDKIIQKAAKDAFDLEWEHSMEKDLYNPNPQNSTFSLVMERCINKSFATIFKDKFIGIYPEVYATAIDKFMLSDNSSLVWEFEECFFKWKE